MSANQSSKTCLVINTLIGNWCIVIICYMIPINPVINYPVKDTQNVHLVIDLYWLAESAIWGTTVLVWYNLDALKMFILYCINNKAATTILPTRIMFFGCCHHSEPQDQALWYNKDAPKYVYIVQIQQTTLATIIPTTVMLFGRCCYSEWQENGSVKQLGFTRPHPRCMTTTKTTKQQQSCCQQKQCFSDVVVIAQSLKNMALWYNEDAPNTSTLYQNTSMLYDNSINNNNYHKTIIQTTTMFFRCCHCSEPREHGSVVQYVWAQTHRTSPCCMTITTSIITIKPYYQKQQSFSGVFIA